MDFLNSMKYAANIAKVNLSEKQYKDFVIYNDLLLEWNEKINLTAITCPQEVAVKHMIDSLSCYDDKIFTQNCSVVDVGTGAGFPGIPLKIFRSDIRLTLLDSLNKRLLFLNELIGKIGLENAIVLHDRAEDAGRRKELRNVYDVALSRAVARLNVLIELCLPFVKVGGYFVALKGAQFAEEIDEAKNAILVMGGELDSVKRIQLPGLDDVRAVVVIKKVRLTPGKYPRRAGLLEKNPL